MQTPDISIVIPTYNHGCFIKKALDSVRDQTFKGWEALVINNYSHDDTVEIVESYQDERIKLYNFKNHGNIAASRNYALSLTKAPIVAFLDSDDFWYPQKLEAALRKIQQGYDVVCHAEIWAGPNNHRRTVKYGPEKKAAYKELLFQGNCISTSAVVAKRKFIDQVGGFSMSKHFVTAEDYDLWLKLAKIGAKFGFINDAYGEYTIHEGNQSRYAIRNMEAVMAVFHEHIAINESNAPQNIINRREAMILYGGARGLQNVGQYRDAWGYLYRSFLRYPWFYRLYIAILFNIFRYVPRM